MFDQITKLLQHPLFNLVSIFIGFLGVMLAVYFYFKTKKEQKPLFFIRNFNFLNESFTSIPDINVKFQDKQIKCLSALKLAFWNAGSLTLRGEDMSKADPFRLEVKSNAKFLSVKILSQSSKTVMANVVLDSKQGGIIQISFDYLDKNQGFVILALHTGTRDEDISLLGSFKGSHPISRFSPSHTWRLDKIFILVSSILAYTFLTFAISIPFWISLILFIILMYPIGKVARLIEEKFLSIPPALKFYDYYFNASEFT